MARRPQRTSRRRRRPDCGPPPCSAAGEPARPGGVVAIQFLGTGDVVEHCPLDNARLRALLALAACLRRVDGAALLLRDPRSVGRSRWHAALARQTHCVKDGTAPCDARWSSIQSRLCCSNLVKCRPPACTPAKDRVPMHSRQRSRMLPLSPRMSPRLAHAQRLQLVWRAHAWRCRRCTVYLRGDGRPAVGAQPVPRRLPAE